MLLPLRVAYFLPLAFLELGFCLGSVGEPTANNHLSSVLVLSLTGSIVVCFERHQCFNLV